MPRNGDLPAGQNVWDLIGLAYAALPAVGALPDWRVLVAESERAEEAASRAFELARSKGFELDLLIGLVGYGRLLDAAMRERTRTALKNALPPEDMVNQTQAMLDNSSLADFEVIVPALLTAGRACAQITVAGAASGTGFLVGDDLVLTAAHVLQDLVDSKGAFTSDGGGRIAVRFPIPPSRPLGWPTADFAVAEEWLRFWRCCQPKPATGSPGPDELDCALIRLARPVPPVVPRLDVSRPPDGAGTTQVHVLGFIGGTGQLKFDGGVLLRANASGDSRLRHQAGAVDGMSGGPYLDWKGQVFGLHEGCWHQPEPRHNRGVALRHIRQAMCRDGDDPLQPARRKKLWQLTSEPARQAWSQAAGRAWTARETFHPVFGRAAFQDWIAEAGGAGLAGQPVALVTGDPQTGKSFSADILRACLNPHTDAVAHLPPEVIRAADDEDLLARLGEAAGMARGMRSPAAIDVRPQAGVRRLDLLEPWLADLAARTVTGKPRRIWLVADLGQPDTWELPGVREFWADLLKLAPNHREWLRVVLIGLNGDLADSLALNLGRDKVFIDRVTPVTWAEIWPVAQQSSATQLDEREQNAAWMAALSGNPSHRLLGSVGYVVGLR